MTFISGSASSSAFLFLLTPAFSHTSSAYSPPKFKSDARTRTTSFPVDLHKSINSCSLICSGFALDGGRSYFSRTFISLDEKLFRRNGIKICSSSSISTMFPRGSNSAIKLSLLSQRSTVISTIRSKSNCRIWLILPPPSFFRRYIGKFEGSRGVALLYLVI